MRRCPSATIRPLLLVAILAAIGPGNPCPLGAADPPGTADSADAPEIPAPAYVTLALARDPAIHAELKLSTAQIARVLSAVARVDEPLWQLRDVPVKTAGPRLEELRTTLHEQLQKELSREQQDRFRQLVLQARGWKALLAADVHPQLNLTDSQRDRIRTAIAEATQQRQQVEQDLAGQTPAEQVKTRERLRKDETLSIAGVLTDKQQNSYTRILGKAFDFTRVTQVGCIAPELRGVTAWINSEPLTLEQSRGKVVVLHFWAFGCINCIRNLPHYQGWYESFPKSELTIIGIQTPETAAERKLENLQRNVQERKIEYPVVFDAESANWKAWGNNMWPSVYLIDKRGRVRHWWYGELNWEGARGEEFLRQRIAALLAEDP